MPGRPSELQYVETPLLKQLKSLGWSVKVLNDAEKHLPESSFRSSLREGEWKCDGCGYINGAEHSQCRSCEKYRRKKPL